MKINRIKLVTLLGKQDCKEFDNHIIELLQEQYSEEDIDISSKLLLITKCNAKQLELLKSIGVEPESEWSRNTTILKSNYYVVERDRNKGFCREHYFNGVTLNPNFVFDTREEAELLDPNGQIFLMFSIKDNPNWDMQEKLMEIGTRYHLG